MIHERELFRQFYSRKRQAPLSEAEFQERLANATTPEQIAELCDRQAAAQRDGIQVTAQPKASAPPKPHDGLLHALYKLPNGSLQEISAYSTFGLDVLASALESSGAKKVQ